MSAENSRLQKLILLQRLVIKSAIWLIALCVLALVAERLWVFPQNQDGFPSLRLFLHLESLVKIIPSAIGILFLVEGVIFWSLYFQVRILHIVYSGSVIKPRWHTWKSVLMYALGFQLCGSLVLLAFWKQSLTAQYGIPYIYNAVFHSVMLQAGSGFTLWPGGFYNPDLASYSLLKLAITGVFIMYSLGIFIVHDIGSIRRLRSRMQWPKQGWQKTTYTGLLGLGLLIACSLWLFPDHLGNEKLVTKAIDELFSAVGNFSGFINAGFGRFALANVMGTPFGSVEGLGLLGLIMLLLLPGFRRIFSRAMLLPGILFYVIYVEILVALFAFFGQAVSGYFLMLILLTLKFHIIILALTQTEIRKLARKG